MSHTGEAERGIRAGNHQIKAAHDFACAECGHDTSVLVVVEKKTGELTTRCADRCLDRRAFDVRPHQWDSARASEEKAMAKR